MGMNYSEEYAFGKNKGINYSGEYAFGNML